MATKNVRKIAAVVFWVLVWQVAAMVCNRSLLIPVPTPGDTLSALHRLGGTSAFWLAVGASALRICIGFAAALVFGTACAVLTQKWDLFAAAADPMLRLIRAVPVASVTILVFLWLPRERIPGFISFLTVFPIVWSNVSEGIRHADRGLIEMAQVFGMGRREILRRITLPAIRPYFIAAAATGLGFAWKSGVAAEIICRTDHSLGNLLWSSKSSIAYDEVFALTLVIVIWSVALESGARTLLKGGRRDKI